VSRGMTVDSSAEIYVRSGGRRIALYAEVGGYFSPDGQLDAQAFRRFLGESLRPYLLTGDGSAGAAVWLSTYLENLFAYLEEKGMGSAVMELFEAAVDEAAAQGLAQVTLGPQWMQKILSMAAARPEPGINRKHAPDDKKKRILDSALQVFTERGFHQATIDEIAAASGVAKGTVYRFFDGKEDLLDQLLLATSQKIVERFSGAFTGQENVLDEIQRFIEEWLRFVEENHRLYRLIQAEGIIPHSGRRTMFYEYLIANFPMAKERVVAMNSSGVLKTLSFSTVIYGMLGFIDGVVNKWFRSGMDYPLHDEVPTILEVLFNGFVRERDQAKVFFVPPESASAAGDAFLP